MSCNYPCVEGCNTKVIREWSRGLWYLRWYCDRVKNGVAMREPNQKEPPSESE